MFFVQNSWDKLKRKFVIRLGFLTEGRYSLIYIANPNSSFGPNHRKVHAELIEAQLELRSHPYMYSMLPTTSFPWFWIFILNNCVPTWMSNIRLMSDLTDKMFRKNSTVTYRAHILFYLFKKSKINSLIKSLRSQAVLASSGCFLNVVDFFDCPYFLIIGYNWFPKIFFHRSFRCRISRYNSF